MAAELPTPGNTDAQAGAKRPAWMSPALKAHGAGAQEDLVTWTVIDGTNIPVSQTAKTLNFSTGKFSIPWAAKSVDIYATIGFVDTSATPAFPAQWNIFLASQFLSGASGVGPAIAIPNVSIAYGAAGQIQLSDPSNGSTLYFRDAQEFWGQVVDFYFVLPAVGGSATFTPLGTFTTSSTQVVNATVRLVFHKA